MVVESSQRVQFRRQTNLPQSLLENQRNNNEGSLTQLDLNLNEVSSWPDRIACKTIDVPEACSGSALLHMLGAFLVVARALSAGGFGCYLFLNTQ